ncbi:MAG: DNA recombination protein RmuC, partial [Clostridia bacterium]|nr:DNA recombination protein RmuC [Clostridia bacterium]
PTASGEVVEFAIKIPSGEAGGETVYLPVDSKFPMEDYIRICDAADASDPEALAEARKALEKRILTEGKNVAKYIHIPHTTPFAIVYLATEGLYAEITSSRSGITERLQNEHNILVAGPSTIMALLTSLSMGFKVVAINEKANEVRRLLAAAKTQYDKFGIILEKARKKISDAGKTLDEAQSRNAIIQKKLRNVEALDSASSENILELNIPDTTEDDYE